MDNIISQMVILLLLVAAGFITNKFGLTGGDFDRKLSNFIINVSCPCLIVASVMGDTVPDRGMIIPLLAVGFATYIVLFGISWLLPRYFVKRDDVRGMYSFMLMFGNVGFIGYPVVASIFGHEAVFYASLLNVPNTLFIFAVGTVFVLGQKGRMRFNTATLYCPGMIASYISIIIVAMGWEQVPSVVSEPLRLLGNITVPGALLVIGSSMAQIGRHHVLGSPSTYVMASLRLLAIPAAVFFLSLAVGVDDKINAINTVLIGMPVASYGTMFCLKYGRDETDMVRGTLITTIMSVVTIPLLTLLF